MPKQLPSTLVNLIPEGDRAANHEIQIAGLAALML